MLLSKLFFKIKKNIIFIYFQKKNNTLKNNHYYNSKHTLSSFKYLFNNDAIIFFISHQNLIRNATPWLAMYVSSNYM
jgi:hypothetical protein